MEQLIFGTAKHVNDIRTLESDYCLRVEKINLTTNASSKG